MLGGFRLNKTVQDGKTDNGMKDLHPISSELVCYLPDGSY